jgi:MATE family multidrug resistance protein
MVITTIGYWMVALPAAWVLGFPAEYGAVGVWIGYTLGIVLAAVALPWRNWSKTSRN